MCAVGVLCYSTVTVSVCEQRTHKHEEQLGHVTASQEGGAVLLLSAPETSAQLLNAADVCEESSSQILIIISSLLTAFILTLVLHPCLDL